MSAPHFNAIVDQLEALLACPTFVALASWQGEYAVDLDEDAGHRLVAQVLRRFRQANFQQAALVIVARGGHVAFAETLLRALRHLDVELSVVVPHEVSGMASVLALGAGQITLHPAAGLGACDRGLCVLERVPWTASLLDHLPDFADTSIFGEQATRVLSTIANQQRYRAEVRLGLARQVSARQISPELVAATSLERLGEEGVADLGALTRAGARVQVASPELSTLLEQLLLAARDNHGLFDTPRARFERSTDWADEVEFAPAEDVAGALLASAALRDLYLLDTGSPDPDSPRLQGRWVRPPGTQ
ncbi:hypothetical protein DV096_02660 [Bradymonadaceae bacterium TMQ3]|uniref:Uncharacterized protein n=1 Tax=Lujinxingia sediminis TaxID=2480984 RepID=A0ABY0CXN6_9DELT|nr:hypothetical protein [Lujinxingia sediminis]RDV39491.1 hypothetical protein DV096_02660 [Bradymonadaceae bacterium TMQ3]RVU48464.1 hypothetical protein EA187_03240 [Lujinxingia sediminis]TXC77766.1 hypothetical protein FRC91_03255 [Bradymonadales bacterium TMQ1]